MYNAKALKEGITTNIGFVLLHIDSENGTPATKIAPLMGMESRSLTRMLSKLEEQGLIYRQGDPNDGRMVRIFLTEKGLHKKARAKEVVIGFNKQLYAQIPPADLEVFFRVLDQIGEIARENHQGNVTQAVVSSGLME
ncbi:MAG: MarR family transcriptional regulator [Bacteroidetes bacterium]|nr:MAG: MarR family transcriptional regulator [Bacteroidota bacterium]